jgi:hypothetical protein
MLALNLLAAPAASVEALAPPDFQVLAAKLSPEAPGASADAAGVLEYSGRCPVLITFKGAIKANGPGTVTYTFARSDGARGPVYRLIFEQAGIKEVSTTWRLGDRSALPSFEGFEEIRILSPNPMGSNKAKFRIKCSR